jgi:hypothetical protein
MSNIVRHRIAALLRFRMKPKSHGWAARGALAALDGFFAHHLSAVGGDSLCQSSDVCS